MGNPEDLESDRLALVPPLPNFGLVGNVLGAAPFLRDAFKLIQRWDCAAVTTHPLKLSDTLSIQPWIPCEFLKWECGQSRKEGQ